MLRLRGVSKMRAALEQSGLPSSAINLDVVSSDRAYFRDSSKVLITTDPSLSATAAGPLATGGGNSCANALASCFLVTVNYVWMVLRLARLCVFLCRCGCVTGATPSRWSSGYPPSSTTPR